MWNVYTHNATSNWKFLFDFGMELHSGKQLKKNFLIQWYDIERECFSDDSFPIVQSYIHYDFLVICVD